MRSLLAVEMFTSLNFRTYKFDLKMYLDKTMIVMFGFKPREEISTGCLNIFLFYL